MRESMVANAPVDPKFARKLLDAAVARGGEIDLDDLVAEFAERDRFAEIIPALRSLEDGGKGRFVVGRRGHTTRFICDSGLLEKKRSLSKQRDVTEVAASATALKEYEFPVRRGVSAVLRLPGDLTKLEADRLSQFILAIPFE